MVGVGVGCTVCRRWRMVCYGVCRYGAMACVGTVCRRVYGVGVRWVCTYG